MSRAPVGRAASIGRTVPAAGLVLVIGGILAGLAFPRLLKSGRVAAKRIAGTRFTSGVPGIGRPSANPAAARAA